MRWTVPSGLTMVLLVAGMGCAASDGALDSFVEDTAQVRADGHRNYEVAIPPAPACSEADGKPVGVGLEIGTSSNGIFVASQPATVAALEIVQGNQGGVHVEVAFRLILPDLALFGGKIPPKVQAEVRAETRLDCCDGELVGTAESLKRLVWKSPDVEGAYDSGPLPVIFDQTVAAPYHLRHCCVTVEVAFRHHGAQFLGLGQQTFFCVDEQ